MCDFYHILFLHIYYNIIFVLLWKFIKHAIRLLKRRCSITYLYFCFICTLKNIVYDIKDSWKLNVNPGKKELNETKTVVYSRSFLSAILLWKKFQTILILVFEANDAFSKCCDYFFRFFQILRFSRNMKIRKNGSHRCKPQFGIVAFEIKVF